MRRLIYLTFDKALQYPTVADAVLTGIGYALMR